MAGEIRKAAEQEITQEERAELEARVAVNVARLHEETLRARMQAIAKGLRDAARQVEEIATSQHWSMEDKVYQVQHTAIWAFANLNLDAMVTDLARYQTYANQLKQMDADLVAKAKAEIEGQGC